MELKNELPERGEGQPIVRVKQISHRYAVHWAIRDLDFEISRRGIYGLLGANGSGKSTLMNILCGVLKPTDGDVFIHGISARQEPVAAKRLMGFLPQQPPLHTDLTVQEYLMHCAGLRLIPRKQQAEAVYRVLEKCGITHFRDRLIRNLSGGYQQRVGIAQAIIHQPELVVLDEPTNGLDPNQILEIRALIKEIAADRTVLISTHMLSEVQAACQEILMLAEGRVVFTGTVEEFDNYIVPNSIIVGIQDSSAIHMVADWPEVLQVETLGGIRYRLRVSDVNSTIDKIITESVHLGWGLKEIQAEANNMEAIFAELSRKKQAPSTN
jgi:ABC-2 type transport system ATP-binding protein